MKNHHIVIITGVLAAIVGGVSDGMSSDAQIPAIIAWLVFLFFLGKFLYEKYFLRNKPPLKSNNAYSNIGSKELWDRALGEFHSKNYILSINFLNELDDRGLNDFRIFSTRAACYKKLGNYNVAMEDAIKSISIEPNYELNRQGYDIRNELIEIMKKI